ncbi:MAG: hypothetical protein EOP84_09245 [Verrucomicrobiaceae bacterium]|nr:MAG: hypothetical protein EOP84_09245 [Verrucomicrobiaceae bacterium]
MLTITRMDEPSPNYPELIYAFKLSYADRRGSLTQDELAQVKEIRQWFSDTMGSGNEPGRRWRVGFYNIYFEHPNDLFAFRMRWL